MSGFKNVLFYAQEYKNKIYLAFFLILLSVIAGIAPYLITYDIIINFVENSTVTPAYLLVMAVIVGFFYGCVHSCIQKVWRHPTKLHMTP